MSKSCLDYNPEPSAPKSRYRSKMRADTMIQVTTRSGNWSHRSFVWFPAVWLISCLYIMPLSHLYFSNLNHFVATCAEPVKWFSHLHQRHLKSLVLSHTWPEISRHLFIYRRLFMCRMGTTCHMNSRQNCNVFLEICFRLQVSFCTSYILCLLQHCYHTARVWRSTAAGDNPAKMHTALWDMLSLCFL